MVKFCWLLEIIFQIFYVFFIFKNKRRISKSIMLVEVLIVILYYLATMSPLGWYLPHLLYNTDTQYLGDQHWQQCWFYRFFFFFVSICLSVSLYVSVHLFTIKLKFLKTHYSYRIAQFVYVNLVSGLELDKGKPQILILRNSSKKLVGKH